MSRINYKTAISGRCDTLNRLLGRPTVPHGPDGWNVGCFHAAHGPSGWYVAEITNEDGGESQPLGYGLNNAEALAALSGAISIARTLLGA